MLAVACVAVSLIYASSTEASVTLGQVAPGVITSCATNFDFLQHSSPDNAYVMPATGTITSWTHRSQAGVGQMVSLKIFRRIGDPATYQLVGRDGPNPIDPNITRTFSSSVPVNAGDVLGLTGESGAVSIGCSFSGLGERGNHTPNVADGGFADFTISNGSRLNLSAVLNPTNSFTRGAITRHKKKGTASLALNLPNPGELTVSGNGVKTADIAGASSAVSAGETSVLVKATGKKRKKLNATGKVKLSLTITYTPTSGDPASQSVKVKLRKK